MGPGLGFGPRRKTRPGAFIRGNVIAGAGCVLGNSCEYKNCLLLDEVETPHFNYVGDSVLGNRAHLGAGVICSTCASTGNTSFVHLRRGRSRRGFANSARSWATRRRWVATPCSTREPSWARVRSSCPRSSSAGPAGGHDRPARPRCPSFQGRTDPCALSLESRLPAPCTSATTSAPCGRQSRPRRRATASTSSPTTIP